MIEKEYSNDQITTTGQFKWTNEENDDSIIEIHSLENNPKYQALVEIYEHEHLLDQFDIFVLIEQLYNCLTEKQKINMSKIMDFVRNDEL